MENLVHKMEKLGFSLDDDSATCDQKKINPQASKLLAIQRCIKQLVHACQCRDANCKVTGCQKMKRGVQHDKNCKLKAYGGCSVCKLFTTIYCYHAKQCQEAKCPVPHCSLIKNVMKRKGLQQGQILKRCSPTIKNRSMSASPGNSNSSNQPSPGAQPHSSPHPPQPGIGMKPSTGPPGVALQAVQQVQADAAARQTAPYLVASSVNYGKGNPVVSPPIPNMGLIAATQQMQNPVAQMMSGVPNYMLNMGNLACWEGSGLAQNPQEQPNPQFSLRQPTLWAGQITYSIIPLTIQQLDYSSDAKSWPFIGRHAKDNGSMAAVSSDSKISSISSATSTSPCPSKI